MIKQYNKILKLLYLCEILLVDFYCRESSEMVEVCLKALFLCKVQKLNFLRIQKYRYEELLVDKEGRTVLWSLKLFVVSLEPF